MELKLDWKEPVTGLEIQCGPHREDDAGKARDRLGGYLDKLAAVRPGKGVPDAS